ncbi:uncharacterized protein LOC112902779 isoform X2 [Panicum hallii]|uniref:uncharacterized protein LOC112902779 isoform X2 n=1 Tax=Panicum hallii TaxID=206008 RepID=UPI000DF4F120|nr:uncharacterized protein LOC112902779 isoform X2 [Panicum hallii]
MHARLPCAVLAARAVPASRIRARLRTMPRWMSAFPPRPVPQRRLQIEEGTYGYASLETRPISPIPRARRLRIGPAGRPHCAFFFCYSWRRRRRRSKSLQSRRSAWTTSERASLSRPFGRLKSSRSCTSRTLSISKRSSPRQGQREMSRGSKMKIAWFIASSKREMLSGGIHTQDCFEQLNILELFLDCITETNERLIEFGIGGICNSCVDPANALVIVQCGGIPLVIYNTYQQRCGALSISEANKTR